MSWFYLENSCHKWPRRCLVSFFMAFDLTDKTSESNLKLEPIGMLLSTKWLTLWSLWTKIAQIQIKWSIRLINWNQKTKTKNQNIFCWCKWKFDDFFIHFEKGGEEKKVLFLPLSSVLVWLRILHLRKKTFFTLLLSCPPYSKCIKKLSNFHLHQQKIFWFLVFSFSFWFQLIQG